MMLIIKIYQNFLQLMTYKEIIIYNKKMNERDLKVEGEE